MVDFTKNHKLTNGEKCDIVVDNAKVLDELVSRKENLRKIKKTHNKNEVANLLFDTINAKLRMMNLLDEEGEGETE